jgi:hypothetical protein
MENAAITVEYPLFFHDCINNRDCETAEYGWQCMHSDIRDVVRGVAITDIVELEVCIKTYEPASQT